MRRESTHRAGEQGSEEEGVLSELDGTGQLTGWVQLRQAGLSVHRSFCLFSNCDPCKRDPRWCQPLRSEL